MALVTNEMTTYKTGNEIPLVITTDAGMQKGHQLGRQKDRKRFTVLSEYENK